MREEMILGCTGSSSMNAKCLKDRDEGIWPCNPAHDVMYKAISLGTWKILKQLDQLVLKKNHGNSWKLA